MSVLQGNIKITEGVNTGLIGTGTPSGSVGLEPDSNQVGFFVYTAGNPYTIWFKDSGGTWAVHKTFTAQTVAADGIGYAWSDNQAVYFQVSGSGDTVYLFSRSNSVMIDGDVSDGNNDADTLVTNGLPSVGVQAVAINQFSQFNDVNGHIIPSQNAQFDIGSAEYKVRHFYLSSNSMYIGDTWIKAEGDQIKTPNLLVGDINLNNTGRQNEVDGTSGHWSIQEGAEDLFLINRNTGKKYKFNLTEVE